MWNMTFKCHLKVDYHSFMPQMYPMNWFMFSLVPLLMYLSMMNYNLNFNKSSSTYMVMKMLLWKW